MAGITDAPFRAAAWRNGAGMVVTEMVAGEELARGRADVERRARTDEAIRPFVVQLAGREARWMEEGARIAAGLGRTSSTSTWAAPRAWWRASSPERR